MQHTWTPYIYIIFNIVHISKLKISLNYHFGSIISFIIIAFLAVLDCLIEELRITKEQRVVVECFSDTLFIGMLVLFLDFLFIQFQEELVKKGGER